MRDPTWCVSNAFAPATTLKGLSQFLAPVPGRARPVCRVSQVDMPDWARVRADTPAAEKMLHFNNAGECFSCHGQTKRVHD